jgi:hypothetical protein
MYIYMYICIYIYIYIADRHKHWFGTVEMSVKVGTDAGNVPVTTSQVIMTDNAASFEINASTSSQGVWWLNIWVYTSAYCESIILIMR